MKLFLESESVLSESLKLLLSLMLVSIAPSLYVPQRFLKWHWCNGDIKSGNATSNKHSVSVMSVAAEEYKAGLLYTVGGFTGWLGLVQMRCQ